MAGKSSIKTLPNEVRRELDKLLAEGRFTLDVLVEFLIEKGYSVSRSAIGRYSLRFQAVADRMREARELTSTFAKELGDLPNDMGRVVGEVLHLMVFQFLMKAEGKTPKPKDMMLVSQTLKNITTALKISSDMEMKIRTEERKRLEEEQKEKLTQAAQEGSLSKEAAEEALRALFGA